MAVNKAISGVATFFSMAVAYTTIYTAYDNFNEGQKSLAIKYTQIHPYTEVDTDKTPVAPGIDHYTGMVMNTNNIGCENSRDDAFGDFFDQVTENMQIFAHDAWDVDYIGTSWGFYNYIGNDLGDAIDKVCRRIAIFK